MTSKLQLFIDHVLVPALLDRLGVQEHPDLAPPVASIKGEDRHKNDVQGAGALDVGKVPDAA